MSNQSDPRLQPGKSLNSPRIVSAWTPMHTFSNGYPAMSGTIARFIEGAIFEDDVTPVPAVIVSLWSTAGWHVQFPPGVHAPIEGRLAAPSAEIAAAYADDFLHAQGNTGPGVVPLPAKLPPLRDREAVQGGAQCECGYIGGDIVDRHEPCPQCRGMTILGLYEFEMLGFPSLP